MSFDATKPASNESPASFPAQAQTNWSRLETIISANHIFNAGADPATDGKHKFVVMPDQASAPTTAANEVALYSKAVSTVSQLFLRREGAGNEMQLTSKDVADATAQQANGYSCLPGGLLIQWGTYTAPAGVSGNLSFPTPFAAAPYSVVCTINRGTSTASSSYDLVLAATPTASTFKVNSGFSNAHSFYMIAIGIGPT